MSSEKRNLLKETWRTAPGPLNYTYMSRFAAYIPACVGLSIGKELVKADHGFIKNVRVWFWCGVRSSHSFVTEALSLRSSDGPRASIAAIRPDHSTLVVNGSFF